MLQRLLAAIRESKRRSAYLPRHGYPFTVDSHETWKLRLRERYPLAFAEPTPDVAWVDALFDRWLAGDDSMHATFSE